MHFFLLFRQNVTNFDIKKEYKRVVINLTERGFMENLEYEINSNTCAIIALKENKTIIIETNKKLEINTPVDRIINYNCEYYGSSFQGRLQGTKNAIGMKYKLPIIIEESREIIFFPTNSYKNNNCSWLNLNNIEKYQETKNGVIIFFKNDMQFEFEISLESLENQILRASQLLLVLKKRKNS